MYKHLRSSRKVVEAILVIDKDVETIQTFQDLEKEKQTGTLKRKKETTPKGAPGVVNSKTKGSKNKVISSKIVSNKRSSTSKKSFNKKQSDSESDPDLKSRKSNKRGKLRKSLKINESDGSSDDSSGFEADIKKPTTLFENNKDKVCNEQIFGFQTPKRKNGMLLKAEGSRINSPRAKENLTPKSSRPDTSRRLSPVVMISPLKANAPWKISSPVGNETPKSQRKLTRVKTPLSAKFIKTPRSLHLTRDSPNPSEEKENKVDNRKLNIPKTPYSLRTKLKKRISLENKLNNFQDDDSGSEFEFSSCESSAESSDNDKGSDSESSSPEESAVPVQKKPRIILKITNQNEATVQFKPRKGGRKQEHSYVFKSDDYFTHKSAKQVTKTSGNTLKKTPQISRNKMATILSSIQDKHKVCKQKLMNSAKEQFPEWLLFLRENYNILLHGFGSKYKLLNEFKNKMLEQSRVLVINGFFPDLTLKEILDSIMIDLLEMKDTSQDPQQSFELVKKKLKAKSSPDIFLVVHNVDGVALRGSKQQGLLVQLASLNKVHVIASIDHINAPLLWDNAKLSSLNFVWFDVTTCEKYEIETSYESSLLIDQSSGKLVKSSIMNVYKSLNNNAKQIFMLIVKNHLDNKKNSQYQGVSFKDLYSWCRKGFLVTSDLTLRTQLTEFLDHELIKWRNDKQHLYVPINLTILEDFLQKVVECES